MKLISILMMSLAFTLSSAFASSTQLTKITNSMNKDIAYAQLATDSLNEKIEFFIIKSFSSKGELKRTEKVSYEDLKNGNISTDPNIKKYVKVRTENFSAQEGGLIHVRYPINAMRGSYANITLSLERNGDSWMISNKLMTDIKRIHAVINRGAFFPVGVKKLKYYSAQ